eukprot:jgi/Chrzof1/8739/Cz03g22170.t1
MAKPASTTKRNQVLEEPVKLYNNSAYTPQRQIGGVDIQPLKGRGRGVVATQQLQAGDLLMVLEPLGSMLTGPVGQELQPSDLEQHLNQQTLTQGDRYRLSLLYDGTAASMKQAVSFKDFSSNAAQTKATKSAAKAGKGFGASSAQQTSQLVQLTPEQLRAVVQYNCWGNAYATIAPSQLRGQQQHSLIGLWPEFGLINHSCVPNISVSNVSERLLIRVAIGVVPVGAEITTSYLDVSAGGLPLQQRQELLQHSYSFTCKCPRCTVRMVSRLPLFGISQPVLSWVPVLRLYEIVRVFAHQQNATLMQSAIT